MNMVEFLTSLTIFILAHSLPEPTGLRTRMIDRIGKKSYFAGFSILSTILLIWLIWSALRAPYVSLWLPSQFTSLIPVILMLPASILFTTSILRPNSLSLAFIQQPIFAATDVTVLLKHPLLWSFFLWALSHTIANGDLVGVIMFGGLAIFSLVGMRIFEHRAKRTLSQIDFSIASNKTIGPIIPRLGHTINLIVITEVIAGILLYVIVLHLHEPVIGVDPTARFIH
jgi:uncharacterized membrane protein